MYLITPEIQTQRDEYERTQWIREECYRFYVTQRRENCTYLELMDLWLRAPYCSECILSQPFHSKQLPGISSDNWKRDIEWQLGEDMLRAVSEAMSEGESSAFLCKRCGTGLAPWNGDDIYVVCYHLEEHYQIPLEIPGRRIPSDKLKKKIFRFYDHTCFGCARRGLKLHLDHVLPRVLGGTAAFRNLQPLCEQCGEKKGASRPEEIEVYSDMYFGPYPSNSYEGLFW